MRLSILLVFLSVLTTTASVYSQNTRLSLKMENQRITEVFDAIEKQTEFFFFYNRDNFDDSKLVSVNFKDKKIEEILDELFKGEAVTYQILDRNILIKAVAKSNSVTESIGEQQKSVSGKVTDTNSMPLPGVSVMIKGTTNGTITDANGNFSFSNIPADASLVFSFVGMKTQEIPLGNKTQVNVTMEEENIGIEEVVAVGYGIQKKESLTGAVDQVKMDDILGNRPVSNAATAIQGVIPGAQVTLGSGMPGESPSITIRGIESINGGDPLVLVDNVPMDINDINPADIESISVLKDASASSIYGGRAAFGVILIHTKKGKRDRPIKFNYTANFATSNATELPEKASIMETLTAMKVAGDQKYWTGQDLGTWSNLLTEYKANPSKYPEGETTVDGHLYRLAESDLYKTALENSFEQIHNFSFSGGSEKADYRVSFGYSDENGILITNKDSQKKYNVNAYLNADLTSKLTSTLNILYTSRERSVPSNYWYLWRNIVELPRSTNLGYFDPDGSNIPFFTANNILKKEPANSNVYSDIRIFEKLEYKFSKNFKLTGEYTFTKLVNDVINIATDNKYFDTYQYTSVPITIMGESTSYYQKMNGKTDHHALNLYLNYSKNIAGHEFNLLIGTNQELEKYSAFTTKKNDLLSSEVPSFSTAIGTTTVSDSFDESSISGYFSRLNYSYKGKYLLEANVRYDGSSKFPKGDRYGLFPSASAGWVLTKESFMKPLCNIFSLLKLRGSYGSIGNQDIASYAYISGMSSFMSSWIGPGTTTRARTLSVPSLISSSFTWEEVRTKNIGVDMGFLKNSLNLNFDYYIRETLNMLAAGSELPATIGATAPLQNVADLESKGWELGINWKFKKNDFIGTLGINISDDRGYITKFKNEGGLLSQYYDGYKFGEIWGYVTDGYYTVDDFVGGTLDANLMNGTLKEGIPAYYTVTKANPGDIRYLNLDDNGKISPGTSTLSDPGDRKIIGNSNRRYQFGINGNFSFKNFDFSFLLQGVGKRDVWMNNQFTWPYITGYTSFYKHLLDYWTAENPNSYYPRIYSLGAGNTSVNRLPQTRYLLNGAYLRVKNIEFGYTLPKTLSQKLSIDKLRLFVSGENLFKFDHLPKGIDTELTSIYEGAGYPYIRKFSCGLNLTF